MAKAGILSMQRILNYGSFLQAYALKRSLEQLGWTVEFIDYHPGKCLLESSEKRGVKRLIQKGILPCQVAALKCFVNANLQKNLYTIDLICHGTPSPKILELFLKQYNCSLQKLADIKFRGKAGFSISKDAEKIEPSGIQDRYMMGFLEGLFYTDNCYSCSYAALKRTGNITLGDSWGSRLPDSEKRKGISLMLIQTTKRELLLNRAKVHTEDVDLNHAVANNAQLQGPVARDNRRELFFQSIQAGKGFNAMISRYCFKRGIKQYMKKGLRKVRLGGVMLDME